MSGVPVSPPQPNHRLAEPGPSILRSAHANSPPRSRDASDEGEDPLSDVNARFEKLARPRRTREDYYGPGVRRDSSDPVPKPSSHTGLADKLGKFSNISTIQRDVVDCRSDAVAQDKPVFIYQQKFAPVFTPGFTNPSHLSMDARSAASRSMPPGSIPEYVEYRKAVTLPLDKKPTPAARRPRRRSIPPLERPQQDQPDHSRDVFRDAVVNHWATGNNCSSPFLFSAHSVIHATLH